MTALVALAAAGLIAQAPVEDPARAALAGDVVVDAGRITYDVGANRWVLEDGVVLRRGAIVLRARAARFDPATGEVDATGDVLLTDATRAVSAEGLHAVMGGAFEATGVVAFLKDGPVALGQAADVDAARRIGRNRLSLFGETLAASRDGRLRLENARLTLCDCGPRPPSWEVRAREADVIPGERAILRGAVLRVTPFFTDRQVPVLALPWLYVPLADRKSGLLLPEVFSGGATGVTLGLPWFVTLGESADLTVTPTYAFGRRGDDDTDAAGPGVDLELRWAPAPGSAGRAELRWFEDLVDEREHGVAGAAGSRIALTGEHSQPLGARTRLRADAALYDDPFQLRDFRSDVLLRGAPYTRTGALLEHRRDHLVLSAQTAYLLPMGDAYASLDFGRFGEGLDTLHRWPSLTAELLPARLLGPLRIAARAAASRWAPVDGSEAIRLGPSFVLPERATNRLDGRVELSAPVLVGGAFAVEPYARVSGISRHRAQDAATASAWTVGGAALSTELARAYGAYRHVLSPRVEWRASTGVAGDLPAAAALDAWDVGEEPAPGAMGSMLSALPGASFHQLRLSLGNRLARGGAELLRWEVGQDLDLRRGTLGETFSEGALQLGPFGIDGVARALAFGERPREALEPAPRYDSPLDAFTEVRVSARVGSRRGDLLQAGLLALGPGGSGRLAAGTEPLFDLRPTNPNPADPVVVATGGAIAQGTVAARVVVGPATLGYDGLFAARPNLVQQCPGEGGGSRRIDTFHFQQHTASLRWDSSCRCFGATLVLRVDDCGRFYPGASVDLARLAAGAFR